MTLWDKAGELLGGTVVVMFVLGLFLLAALGV